MLCACEKDSHRSTDTRHFAIHKTRLASGDGGGGGGGAQPEKMHASKKRLTAVYQESSPRGHVRSRNAARAGRKTRLDSTRTDAECLAESRLRRDTTRRRGAARRGAATLRRMSAAIVIDVVQRRQRTHSSAGTFVALIALYSYSLSIAHNSCRGGY